MTVRYSDPDPSGLEMMLGELIGENLARDPARRRLLRGTLARVSASDAGVGVTLRLGPDAVVVSRAAEPRVHLRISADSARLLALTSSPLRFGLPDLLTAEGRKVVGDVVARRVRIRGMFAHPRRLAELAQLLSVR